MLQEVMQAALVECSRNLHPKASLSLLKPDKFSFKEHKGKFNNQDLKITSKSNQRLLFQNSRPCWSRDSGMLSRKEAAMVSSDYLDSLGLQMIIIQEVWLMQSLKNVFMILVLKLMVKILKICSSLSIWIILAKFHSMNF